MYMLVQLVIVLIVVGLLLWIVQQIPGLDPAIVRIIRVVVIVGVCIWLIYFLLGFSGGLPGPGLYPLRR